MMTRYTYILHSEDGGIRYVGQTTNPKTRLSKHVYLSKVKNQLNHKEAWIRSLLNRGEKPKMTVLYADNTLEDSNYTEQFFIRFFREQGLPLTNLTDGGDGCLGYKHKKEAKAKVSRANKGNKYNLGNKLSEETKKKISESQKRRMTPRMRDILRSHNLGKKHPKSGVKISKAVRGSNNGRAVINESIVMYIRKMQNLGITLDHLRKTFKDGTLSRTVLGKVWYGYTWKHITVNQ